MAKGLQMRSCNVFNFTSLNIDVLHKKKLCYEQKFTLHHNDDTSLVGQELHEVLQYVKDTKSELTVHLIRGPSDWSNKQTVMAHLTVPKDQSGAWGIIHPKYEEIANKSLISAIFAKKSHYQFFCEIAKFVNFVILKLNQSSNLDWSTKKLHFYSTKLLH